MIFSYNWLQSLIKPASAKASAGKGKLPKPEKLAELLTMHSFEVENLKKVGKDWVLDIAVTANRASDCFSHIGIAREIAAVTNLTFSAPAEKVKLEEDKPPTTFQRKVVGGKKSKAGDFINVDVKSQRDCPRYTARVITDVKVKPSPQWIQERLISCGLRPINNVVDATNYVMLETGQPLHAFDLDKIESMKSKIQNPNVKSNPKSKIQKKKIIIRRAKWGEKIITLEEGDKTYKLDKNVLLIADEKGPLAIAGIKGGKKAEIDNKTKNIVLESANFEPHLIRQASKNLKLKTDASWRFEHGLDPNLTQEAIDKVADLIKDVAGGKIAKGLVDFYPVKTRPRKIKLNLDYLENLLGVKISKKEIKSILQRLGFQCTENISRCIEVRVATQRMDISIPEDLIEEIGRVYGYEKIKADFPTVALIPPKRNFDIFWEEMTKNILKEAGLTEVYNYSFISEEQAKIFHYKENEICELENPISVDFKYLRPSLIPNFLKNVKDNLKYFNEFKIFELGKIFRNKKKIEEKRMLSGTFVQKGGTDGFYQLKGTIDLLLNKLGLSNVWYDNYQPTPEESKITIWNKNKCAEIKVDGEEIGFLGEFSPKILKGLDISFPVTVFDIDFEKLLKLASEEHEYQPISQYPATIRDIAILVPLEVKVEEVLNKIETAGGPLIRDVDLFDIYEGDEIPGGKKNLAFHIIYQAEDRTLSSGEVDRVHQKIVRALEREPEWQVRR